MRLCLAPGHRSRSGPWHAQEGALEFIAQLVTNFYRTLLNDCLCFCHLWERISVTQKLAGFDSVTSATIFDVKAVQLLAAADATAKAALPRGMLRLLLPSHSPSAAGENGAGLLLLYTPAQGLSTAQPGTTSPPPFGPDSYCHSREGNHQAR